VIDAKKVCMDLDFAVKSITIIFAMPAQLLVRLEKRAGALAL
jgi:hypothetical protein